MLFASLQVTLSVIKFLGFEQVRAPSFRLRSRQGVFNISDIVMAQTAPDSKTTVCP